MSWSLVWEHLFIVLAASAMSIVAGVPLGILAYVFPKARGVILRVVDLLQTIPALALLGIIMVFLGAGKLTVIIGITAVKTVPVTGAALPGPSRAPDAPRTAAMPAPAPGPTTRRSRTRGWTASPASCP